MIERIYEDEFQDVLSLGQDKEMKILVSPHTYGSTRLYIKEGGKYFLELAPMHDTSISLLIKNDAQEAIELKVSGDIQENAHVRLGFLDLEDNEIKLDAYVELKAPGAEAELYTAQLVANEKKVGNIEIKHSAPHTTGNMHNFAVLKNKADYEMVANGNIQKGAYGSASHQETRILTLGKEHQTKAIPLLLIDENEVKASHALTIGEPDESQMYYLESRGLSKEMAMGLLSIGYFMPTIELVEDESIRHDLREEMERKVGVYGY